MNSYLLAGISILALGIGAFAFVQTSRLASAEAETTAVRTQLDEATSALVSSQAQVNDMARSRAITMSAMLRERERADAAAAEIQELLGKIAKDVGTVRDAPTAPVLRDTVRGLQNTAFDDGRVPGLWDRTEWRMTAIVHGHVEKVFILATETSCIDTVWALFIKYDARPEVAGHVVLTCSEAKAGRQA